MNQNTIMNGTLAQLEVFTLPRHECKSHALPSQLRHYFTPLRHAELSRRLATKA